MPTTRTSVLQGREHVRVSPETVGAFMKANPLALASVEYWPGGAALYVAGVCVRKWNEYEDRREAERLMFLINAAPAK